MKWSFKIERPEKNEYAGAHMASHVEVSWISVAMLALSGLCFLLFWLLPDLDMEIMRTFWHEDSRFFIGSDWLLGWIRRGLLFSIFAFYVMVIAAGLDAYNKQQPALGFTWDKWAYMGACALAGPVLVVNVILKGNWGRARPRSVEEFGGSLDFTQFWVWADQCQDNCSFTSGEVAGVAMIFFALAFLLSNPVRYVVGVIGILCAAFTAWIRFAMGAHFPSDTIMAAVLMVLVAAEVYYVFYLRSAHWIGKANELQIAKLDKQKLDQQT